MINLLITYLKNSLNYFKRYNELWLGPIAILLFFMSESFVRDIDPQAVPYTMDAIQKILFGHVVFFACTFTVMIVIRLTFPGVFTYLVDKFNDDFVSLNPNSTCENPSKLVLAFCVFASYLLGLILCMQVL